MVDAVLSPTHPLQGSWVLESRFASGKRIRHLRIRPLPFRIGRGRGLDLTLPSQSVSKEHAEIYRASDGLRLRDLHSTNGTYTNRVRIEDAPIREGDVLRFADFEFRLVRLAGAADESGELDLKQPDTGALGEAAPEQYPTGTRELVELLELEKLEIVFQPIVVLPGGAVVAYEALGRGRHPGLPESPLELLRIATSIGVECELSRLFRRKAVECARQRPDLPRIYLNTHPAELEQPGLLESLAELRALAPQIELTLEIHESSITEPSRIAELRQALSAMRIGLAYDDFGVGQARLRELGEVPPDVLKFDRSLLAGIDHAPAPRRRLLSSLVAAAGDLLIQTVAEGIETPAEAEICTRIGFSHAQGRHFGWPHPIPHR